MVAPTSLLSVKANLFKFMVLEYIENNFSYSVRYGKLMIENIQYLSEVLVAAYYGNQDCQASKGFDKYVTDDDAGFC